MAKILIVDDRFTERELLATLLKYARHDAIEAADAIEALRLVQSEHPDLVISDVLLPEIDGYEFVRRLRADPSTAGTAVIFYTAVFNEREAMALAHDCGVSRILSKPTEPEKILHAVAEVLRDRGAGEVSPLPENFEGKHHQLLVDKLMQQVDALRESEERFRLLAEHATDIVFRFRLQPARTWDYVNPAVAAVLGCTPQECYADPELLFRIAHPDSRDDLEDYLSGKSAPDMALLIRWTHKDGRTVWTEIRGTPLFNGEGNLLAMEGMARDVTERMQAEKEILRLNAELERRVIERTAELEAANKELEAFAYSVSHDLRSPLRGIDGYSKVLMEDYHDKLDADGRFVLGQVRASAQEMGTLIDDLLDFSRMGRREMRQTTIDMPALFRRTFGELRKSQMDRRLDLKLDSLPAAYGDPSMLHVVVRNLLENALKFTRPREVGVIEVGVWNGKGGVGKAELEESMTAYFVKDNGVGFDMKYSGKLFQVFQRLHRAEEFEGTGVGLAIVKRIIDRHGGRVWAEAKAGEGAAFYFTLPNKEERLDERE